MKLELSVAEVGYVVRLLKEHVEYYRVLAGNGNCSAQNRVRWELVENLWRKLCLEEGERV
jgi:hypothetical protein